MSFVKILAGANIIAFSLGLFAMSDANAQQFGFRAGRNQLSAVQEQTRANLDNQRAVVDNKISAALNAGQINMSQASSLRAQLQSSRDRQLTAMSDGFLSVAETQDLISDMNAIDSSLSNLATTRVTNQYGVTYDRDRDFRRHDRDRDFRFGNLNSRVDDLSARLERNRSNGRLSSREYNMLRSNLDRIDSRISSMSAGGLSRFERDSLMNQLDRFQSRMNAEINDRDISVNGRYYF